MNKKLFSIKSPITMPMSNAKINFLATLPSLDQIRAKLLGLLNAPAQKIASITQAPGGQLARLINARSEQLEKSNQV